MNPDRIFALDAARGLAALFVCISHIRNAFLVDYQLTPNKNWPSELLYFLTSLGHQAVLIFFVLSGFLVGGSILRSGKSFTWRRFMIARVCRLWLVLVPALILTLSFDLTTLLFFPQAFNGVLSIAWNSGPSSPPSYTTAAFIGNLFFLQTIILPVLGSNGPLWSLANEFWYYILFPLLLISVGKIGNYSHISRCLHFVAVAALVCWLPGTIIVYFGAWVAGALCAVVPLRRLPVSSVRAIAICSSALFCFSLIYSKKSSFNTAFTIHPDIFLTVFFSLTLLAVLELSSRSAADEFSKMSRIWPFPTLILRSISDMSYSLYLTHFPFIISMSLFLTSGQKTAISPNSAFHMLAVLVGSLAIAHATWWLFERHNPIVRKNLLNHLG